MLVDAKHDHAVEPHEVLATQIPRLISIDDFESLGLIRFDGQLEEALLPPHGAFMAHLESTGLCRGSDSAFC
jgi:hypothetical protein